MKLALLIPDGAGVRNFLIGPFLDSVTAKGSVTAFHQIPAELLPLYASSKPSVAWQPLLPTSDTRVALILRNALGFAHMRWAYTASMRYTLGRQFGGSWRTRGAMRAAWVLGHMFASQRRIRHLDRWHAALVGRSSEASHYYRLFQELAPSILFCSNQRASSVVPAVLAAKKLGIPTASFIFSWDNLSSKGRNAAAFDYYLVWSDLMRQELMRFYPDVSAERIVVVGTPQFDPYADSNILWSREEFFRQIGADPSRKLICYSGGDCSIYPGEEHFVRILLELILAEQIKGRPQVILRPCPVDEGHRYAAVRAAHPELIYSAPAWLHPSPGNWACSLPQRSDVQFLANLTHHADLNVNLASTMTLDFAIHDKPVVNVAFDAVIPPPLGVPLGDLYYRFEHYQPVVELGAARLARSSNELAEHVNAYLKDPSLDRGHRQRFVQLEMSGPMGHASARIADALTKIAGRSSSVVADSSGPSDSAVFSQRSVRSA